MVLKFLTQFTIVVFIWNLSLPASQAETPDHEIFLKEMENSSSQTYLQCVNKFNAYLIKFPDDLKAHIEKCKFIQFAQYDDYEDYNPNQAAFDSCVAFIVEKFPDHPDVLIFQTSFLYADDLKDVFATAEQSISENPLKWSKENLGILYSKMSDTYYWDDDYDMASAYIEKAAEQDAKYKLSNEYAMILIEMNRKEEAIEVLRSLDDENKSPWELSQKANLFLQLEMHADALDIYNKIHEIDSTYNEKIELAQTFEAIGEYDVARSYLVADTNEHWDLETAVRNLLIHDLKYQDGEITIKTYNRYRDFGYSKDPIGLYRIKIFFLHPFQHIKFRDIISILAFIFAGALLLLIPSIWVLPVYFIGHHFNYINKEKPSDTLWGLKAFWFVSAGYLIAAFFTLFADPEIVYSHFNSSYYASELSPDQLGLGTLIFIIIFSLFGFATLYKKKYSIFLSNLWSVRKSILMGIGVLFIYKIVIGIYIRFGVSQFNITIDDFATIPNIFLSSKQAVEALIASYGNLVGFLIICLLVPLYEEIIFRGVILDACQKYINFNAANVIQAFLFATIHESLFLFPVFFLFGITTGILRKRSGGLLSGIVMHIVNNSLAISLMLIR